MATRRRRGPKHPGVTLMKPDPKNRTGWRARFRDPDTGRMKKVTLDAALRTDEMRRDWAVRKSRELGKRRMELEHGAPVLNRTDFEKAIAAYLQSCEHRLRPRTIGLYRAAIERFEAWARRNGVRTTADLTSARLAGFREHLLAQRRHVSVKGLPRGKRKKTSERLSPHTVNWQVRAIKSMLNHWRLHGLVAQLDRDAITDALVPLKAAREQTKYLRPRQCQRLLDAAMQHDEETFAETREEHAGLRPVGSTPRYRPIAPFVAFALLTGCRVGEALDLRWDDVDVEAQDHDGNAVGEIRLTASATKTAQARTIGLEVAPHLRDMLSEMKEDRGRSPYVFGGGRRPVRTWVEACRKRMIETYDAPRFTWQTLRRTCGTYLTNAPGIFGSASVYMSARQLGHSVAVAERHYLGVHRGISREARSLEEAMQIEGQMRRILDQVGASGQTSGEHRPDVRLTSRQVEVS